MSSIYLGSFPPWSARCDTLPMETMHSMVSSFSPSQKIGDKKFQALKECEYEPLQGVVAHIPIELIKIPEVRRTLLCE